MLGCVAVLNPLLHEGFLVEQMCCTWGSGLFATGCTLGKIKGSEEGWKGYRVREISDMTGIKTC